MKSIKQKLQHSGLALPGLAATAAALVTVALLSSGCSLKDSSNNNLKISLASIPTVTHAVERAGIQANVLANASGSSFSGPPTSGSQFTCFGVNVTGDGISNSTPLTCSSTSAPMGIIGGLVPVGAGAAIDVQVPAGPHRHVQLIAFRTTATTGCPDMSAIFAEMSAELAAMKAAAAAGTTYTPPANNVFQGIDQPYLVGDGYVDVMDDSATVTLTASYDPTHPQPIFNGCGNALTGGNEMAPTAAYQGYYSVSSGSVNTNTQTVSSLFTMAPSGAMAPGGGYSYSAALASTDMTAITTQPASNSDLSVPGFSVIHQGTGSIYQRTAVQLLWDISTIDLTQATYAGIHLNVRGGLQGTTCPATAGANGSMGPYEVAAAVWDQQDGYWIPGFGSDANYTATQWGWAGWDYLPRSLSQLAITLSDGKKYILVSVETNFASSTTSTYPSCMSSIQIAGASLRYSATRSSNSSGSQLNLGSSDLRPGTGNAGGMSYLALASGTGNFVADGGQGPYTFSYSGPVGGSIDPATGRFVAPSTKGTVTITVTDSSSTPRTTTSQVNVVLPTDVVSLSVTGGASNTGGQCVLYTVTSLNYAGTATSTTSPINLNVNFQTLTGPGPIGTNHGMDSTCSSGGSNPTISGSTSSTTFYGLTGIVGTGSLQVNGSDGTNNYSAPPLAISVTGPGPLTSFNITGPSAITAGTCAIYRMNLTDKGGNLVADSINPHTFTISSGTDYVLKDGACSATVGSVAVARGLQYATFGVAASTATFASTSFGWGTITDSAVPALTQLNMSGPGPQVQVYNAGDLVTLQVTGLPSTVSRGTCYPVTVNAYNINNLLATVPNTGRSFSVMTNNVPGVYGYFYASSAACTAVTPQNTSFTLTTNSQQIWVSFSGSGTGMAMLNFSSSDTSNYAALQPYSLQVNVQ